MKDVMFLYEHGIPAIAPNSEGIIISDKQMQKLSKRFTKIIVFYDNDLAGVKGAHKYKKTFSNVSCVFLKRKYSKEIVENIRKDYENGLSYSSIMTKYHITSKGTIHYIIHKEYTLYKTYPKRYRVIN